MPQRSVWRNPRTTAKGQPSPEFYQRGPHSDHFSRSSHSSQRRISTSTAARSGGSPVSEGFGIDRQRVLEMYLARIVDEKPRLLHRVLSELLQVRSRNADIGERGRHIAVPADRRDCIHKK